MFDKINLEECLAIIEEFTEQKLAMYNGKNGRPAYLAYDGKVYNISSSFLWKEGKHQALHDAGIDLTKAMKKAPHGPEFLKKFPVVGTLNLFNKSMEFFESQ